MTYQKISYILDFIAKSSKGLKCLSVVQFVVCPSIVNNISCFLAISSQRSCNNVFWQQIPSPAPDLPFHPVKKWAAREGWSDHLQPSKQKSGLSSKSNKGKSTSKEGGGDGQFCLLRAHLSSPPFLGAGDLYSGYSQMVDEVVKMLWALPKGADHNPSDLAQGF